MKAMIRDEKRMQLDISVLKHFIWGVKRKMNNLPVVYHTMPIVVGEQGSGKTETIKKLLAPVSDVTLMRGKLTVYSDAREHFNMIDNYVILMDEMEKAEKADIEAIKGSITADHVSYRILGMNKQVVDVNNHSAIGASNENISSKIKDETGARRFWQIDTKQKMDWDVLSSIDYLGLWQSVDESGPAPILQNLTEIQQIQNDEIRTKNSMEQFVVDSLITDSEKDTKKETWTLGSALYSSYQRYCKNTGHKSVFMRPNFYDFLEKKCSIDKKKGKNGILFLGEWRSEIFEKSENGDGDAGDGK